MTEPSSEHLQDLFHLLICPGACLLLFILLKLDNLDQSYGPSPPGTGIVVFVDVPLTLNQANEILAQLIEDWKLKGVGWHGTGFSRKSLIINLPFIQF